MAYTDIEKKRAYQRQWRAQYRQQNKEKCLEYQREWQRNNKEKIAGYEKTRRTKNADSIKSYRNSYYIANKEKAYKARDKWRKNNSEKTKESNKNWKLHNKNKIAMYTSKRRASTLLRTPIWVTEFDNEKIFKKYTLAKNRTEKTGEKWVVDHIIPLQGKFVSGLHVPANLRVIKESTNLRKSNKFDMEKEWRI